MKKLMAIFGLAMATSMAHAYDYPYLTFQTSDGTTVNVAVESLVLTFQDGQLVAQNADGSKTFALADLSKMYFASSTAGISQTAPQTEETVEVYTLSGMFMGRYDSLSQARAALRPGMYVMKSNGQNKKVAIK